MNLRVPYLYQSTEELSASRLKIAVEVADEPLTCLQIAAGTGMMRDTVRSHLRHMVNHGAVVMVKRGKSNTYVLKGGIK